MKSVVGRRVFVGSVVAGLPAVAIGARALAQSGVAGGTHVHPAAAGVDSLTEHVFREMAALHNRMQRGVRGEDARAFAAQLRTLAVYGRQQDLDRQIRAAVGQAIETQGRQGLIWGEPDHARRRAELERYGFKIKEPRNDAWVPPEWRRREAALDALRTEGVTGRFDRWAAVLERAAAAADRRGPVLQVARVRQDTEYLKAYCASLLDDYKEAEALAAVACVMMAVPLVGVIFSAACTAALGGAAALKLLYEIDC